MKNHANRIYLQLQSHFNKLNNCNPCFVLTCYACVIILFLSWQVANGGFAYLEDLSALALLFILFGLISSGVFGQQIKELQVITLFVLMTIFIFVPAIIRAGTKSESHHFYYSTCSMLTIFIFIFHNLVDYSNGRPSLIWPRFRIRSLLTTVVYFAVLMGLGINSRKIADLARAYEQQLRHHRFQQEEWEARLFWEMKAAADAEFARREAYRHASWQTPTDAAPATANRPARLSLQEDELANQIAPRTQPAKTQFKTTSSNPARAIQMIKYYSFLVQKYKAAIRRPWIPVPPDPPAPNETDL